MEIALSKVCGPDDVITRISPEDGTARRRRRTRAAEVRLAAVAGRAFNHMSARLARDIVGTQTWRGYTVRDRANPWTPSSRSSSGSTRTCPSCRTSSSTSRGVDRAARQPSSRRSHRIRASAVDRVLRYERLAEELDEVVGAPRPARLARPPARQGQRPARRSLPRALHRRLPRPRCVRSSPTRSRRSTTSSEVDVWIRCQPVTPESTRSLAATSASSSISPVIGSHHRSRVQVRFAGAGCASDASSSSASRVTRSSPRDARRPSGAATRPGHQLTVVVEHP